MSTVVEYFNLKNLRYMFYPFIPDLLARYTRKSALDKRMEEQNARQIELTEWAGKNSKMARQIEATERKFINWERSLNSREQQIEFRERHGCDCNDEPEPLTKHYDYDMF